MYRTILCAHIQLNAAALIGHHLMLDNDAKHTANATTEFPQSKKWDILYWHQSPDKHLDTREQLFTYYR